MKKLLLAGVAAAAIGGFALAPAAHADLISIGMQQNGVNGGAITTVASGTSSAGFVGGYGTFSTNIVGAAEVPGVTFPDLVFSNAINTSSAAAGTLTVWITGQDLNQPTSPALLHSSFTANEVPSGWTITEMTFYDAGNGLFTTTTPAGSATFSSIGTSIDDMPINFTSAPFSITHEYIIAATGAGTTNNTIDTSVPEPGSLALLGTALLGLGFIGWSTKKRRAA